MTEFLRDVVGLTAAFTRLLTAIVLWVFSPAASLLQYAARSTAGTIVLATVIMLCAATYQNADTLLAWMVSDAGDPAVLVVVVVVVLALCCCWHLCHCGGWDDDLFSLHSTLTRDCLNPGVDIPGAPPETGAVGLQNLGNTCYMNATLQALSAVPELTLYFLSDEFTRNINAVNPHGAGGDMAHAYAAFLKRMWGGGCKAIAPTAFRTAIAKCLPRFAGPEQQDNQEFLVALLDKLHEDLNQGVELCRSPSESTYRLAAGSDVGLSPVLSATRRNSVGSSNIATAPCAAAMPAATAAAVDEAQLARAAWRQYVGRNRSIVTDRFQGQQLCRTVCPTPGCGYVARAFEALMYLSLPLPATSRVWRIRVVASAAVQAMAAAAAGNNAHVAARGCEGGSVEGELASTVDFNKMPLLLRCTVRLPSTATIGELRQAVRCAAYAQYERSGAMRPNSSDRAASSAALSEDCLPFNVHIIEVSGGVMIRPLADAGSCRAFSSRTLVAYVLPSVRPGADGWMMMPVYHRHRVWTRQDGYSSHPRSQVPSAASLAHRTPLVGCGPSSADAVPMLRTDNASLAHAVRAVALEALAAQDADGVRVAALSSEHFFHHPVSPSTLDADCVPNPSSFPDYFARAFVPPFSLPLIVRVHAGDTLGSVRACAELWARATWEHRRERTGVGMPSENSGGEVCGEDRLLCAPLWDTYYKPRMVWLTRDGHSCGLGGVAHASAGQQCSGCPLPATFLVGSEECAAQCGQDHPVWTKPLGLGPGTPQAIAIEWYGPDDVPARRDALQLQGLWDAYGQYAAARAARTAAACAAAVCADSYPLLPDAVSLMPLETISSHVRGMTFSPLALETAEDDVPAEASRSGRRRRAVTDEESEVSLNTCLSLYCRENTLSADNLYNCPGCKHAVAARQSTSLTRPPQILSIVLKRFVYNDAWGNTDKVDTAVTFPLRQLDLGPFVHRPAAAAEGCVGTAGSDQEGPPGLVLPPVAAEPLLYDLFAVVNHSGTLSAGHYSAHVRHPISGSWYFFNDAQVWPEGGGHLTAAASMIATEGGGDLDTLLQSPQPSPPQPAQRPQEGATCSPSPRGAFSAWSNRFLGRYNALGDDEEEETVAEAASAASTAEPPSEAEATLRRAASDLQGCLLPTQESLGVPIDDSAIAKLLVTPAAYVLMYRRRGLGLPGLIGKRGSGTGEN